MARKKVSAGSMAVSTRAIQGPSLHSHRGPVAPALVQTSTYRLADSGDAVRYAKGDPNVYVYSRYHNPTVREAQERLALMMNAESALLFSSGMAAITTAIFSAARAGDNIISTPGLYGGTYRFFRDILPGHGIDVRYVYPDALHGIATLASPRTRIVYCETPTNPTLGIVDITSLVKETRRVEKRLKTKIIIMCDNTFATILNQDPLSLGVDVVLESGTKYLGGHSDILAGVVSGTKRFIKGVHTQLKYFGGSADPFAAWLLLRSLKTFSLRVERQNENALALAHFLRRHRKISRVLYPGLPSHPQHKIAAKQMSGFGGVVTIEVRGGLRTAVRVSDSLQVAVNAMSLGSVETLVSIPVYSSHVNMTGKELDGHGVTPGMIRISVGVEDIDDLKRDFAAALSRA